ncbi:MAG: serine/threonine protein kinase, partial [Nannocystaceae bacterium]
MGSGTDDRHSGGPSTAGPISFDVDLDAALLDALEDSSLDAHIEGDSAAASSEKDVLFGAVLADRYRVLELIGKGGMGKVYLAEHIAIRKKVAIKVLSQAYCHRPDQVQRFLREAQAASTINHDNVIEIFDYGETDTGSVFFAMEMLEGQDLGGLLDLERRLPWTRARRIFLQITRALEAAHSHGVIHRDIKPENCFVLQRPGKVDFVKVLDFGIAKVVDEERKNAHTLTQAGALIGTPEYMAPEQVQGGAADRRMDIYSVGCIMYQALTGELPFEDATMFGVLTKQVSEDPVPLQERAPDAEIPQAVADVVLRAMAKSFDDRYQTMAELAEAIENLGENPLAAASATAVAG